MKLEHKGPPIVAQPFYVTASEFSGNIAIEIYVGSRLISQRDCPDPPCHEFVMIPEVAAGEMLRVVAWDATGQQKKLELPVVHQSQEGMTVGI